MAKTTKYSLETSPILPEAVQAKTQDEYVQSHSPTTKTPISSSHRRSMLRPLVERFHSRGGHSQRQWRIKTAKFQLYELETSCSPKFTARE